MDDFVFLRSLLLLLLIRSLRDVNVIEAKVLCLHGIYEPNAVGCEVEGDSLGGRSGLMVGRSSVVVRN